MATNVAENRESSNVEQRLEQITIAIDRLTRRFDEFARAFLNAKFPYGDGHTDRWSRRG